MPKFEGMNVQVLGISVDHVPCLKAWAESLGGVHYPLLSDFWPHGEVSRSYGVLRPEGFSERAIFIMDKMGSIRYIDIHAIDQQPSNDVLFAELQRIDPQAYQNVTANEPVELPHGGIVMYCTSWCPDCRRARAWLKERNLAYTEVDIDRVPGAAEQLRKWTGGNLTTPTFDIDGQIIVDFNVMRLCQTLNID